MALNSTAINGSSLNGGGSAYFKAGAASAALGLAASAYISVVHPAGGQATVSTASYDVSMRVETNGYGQTLTDLAVDGGGTRLVLPGAEGKVALSGSCAADVTRFMAGVAGLDVAGGARGGVFTWGSPEASLLPLGSQADGVRRVIALGEPARVRTTVEPVIGSKVHYVHADSSVWLTGSARQTITHTGSTVAAEYGFVSLSAGGIRPEDGYIGFVSSAYGNPIIGYRADGTVSFTSEASIWLLADAKGTATIAVQSVAEPAINKVHEATAQGSFGKVTTADDARVRTNAYGLAAVGLGSTARAWTQLFVSADTLVSFKGEPLEWNIASLAESVVAFDFSASAADATRTRLARAHAAFGLNTFEFSTAIRGVAADSSVDWQTSGASYITRGVAGGTAFGFDTSGWAIVYHREYVEAEGAFGFDSSGWAIVYHRKYVEAESVFGFDSSAQVTATRRAFAEADIDLLTARAEPGSNLSQPAPEFRSFSVPGYEAAFIVPDDGRRFVA